MARTTNSAKFSRCLQKVKTQHRNPGYKHWKFAARSICTKSCGGRKKKR